MTLKKFFQALRKIRPLFLWLVLVPSSISCLYFTFIASPIYVSQAIFVVRSSNVSTPALGTLSLLQNVGFSKSQDDTFSVQSFITSRSAVAELEKKLPLRSYYSNQGDWWQKFNTLGLFSSNESFYQYFRNQVAMSVDSLSGIATLSVKAFTSKQAQEINQQLLLAAESLVNRLNERALTDTVKYAQEQLEQAQRQAQNAALKLAQFQVENKIINPTTQVEGSLTLMQTLQQELLTTQGRIEQLRNLSPQTPQLVALKQQAKSLEQQLQNLFSGITSGSNSLVFSSVEYQELMLANTIAQQQVAASLTSLQTAKNEAMRKQLYLEIISPANEPDLALEPQRIYSILATIFFSLILFGLINLILASIREHKN